MTGVQTCALPIYTLIIFDEIQEAPRALEALKYFCETAPEYHREYLEAMGEEALARLIPEKDYGLMGDFRDKYIFWLKNYYYVGGMPEVVGLFREHKDYRQVRALQTSILEQYEADFGKHASAGELARIRMVWNSIPMQLAKENKKFFFGQIKQGFYGPEGEGDCPGRGEGGGKPPCAEPENVLQEI